MTTTINRPSPTPVRGLAAMYTGLAFTLVAMIAPFADRATTHVLADHIRAGYPTYSPERIDAAVTTYLVMLTVVGVLGVASWAWTIWAVRSGRRWARWAATAMFALGTAAALTALLTEDTSGDTGLAPQLGWLWMAPSLAGLVAVVMLWRRRSSPIR